MQIFFFLRICLFNYMTNISVIIRTRNEERWIGHSIQSVLNHLPNSEIIIVDNKSNDETIKIQHIAENRGIFANGALQAVKWGMDKGPGLFSMTDVLNI